MDNVLVELRKDVRYITARNRYGWINIPHPIPTIPSEQRFCKPPEGPTFPFTFSINAFTFVDNVQSQKQTNFTYLLNKETQNLLNQRDTFLRRTPDTSDDESHVKSRFKRPKPKQPRNIRAP